MIGQQEVRHFFDRALYWCIIRIGGEASLAMRTQYPLQTEFSIDKLYTFHYYELAKSFHTIGEKPDFWELVYVDKGETELFTDNGRFQLKQGDLFLLYPNQFHGVRARDALALTIVSFESRTPLLVPFHNRICRLVKEEHHLLTQLLREGYGAFDPPITTLFHPHLGKNAEAPFGCEQLIKNYLEILLISLLRRFQNRQEGEDAALSVAPSENRKAALLVKVIDYMHDNLSASLKLEQMCGEFLIGKTQLKALFKDWTGLGPIQYFNRLKLEKAKTMIREELYNYSEIADRLGYSSVHYFSSTFKKATGMTPTEYARTAQARITSRR
ncbi:MAG: transcriptional regulator, AraC family [Paenibacillus sp.]|nr:transcriptional regulator, AraC family [Paenibacillus sp.]